MWNNIIRKIMVKNGMSWKKAKKKTMNKKEWIKLKSH